MITEMEVCNVCGAGGSCNDCLGTGVDRMGPNTGCISCGESGQETPRYSSWGLAECTAAGAGRQEVRT